MRIIGGRDYYDGVMAYGQDDTVYVRKRITDIDSTKAANLPLDYPTGCRWLRHSIEAHTGGLIAIPILVWFAGVRYGAIKLEEKYKGDQGYSQVFWNKENFLEALEKNTINERIYVPSLNRNSTLRQTMNGVFDSQGRESDKTWLIENGVGIAVGEFPKWENDFVWKFDCDGLKNINFPKILDPFTAYQELSMWVGGVLPKTGNEMVSISDEDKITKRGFDKWSFRKMPGQ